MAVQLLNQADDKVTIACAIDKNIVIMKWRFKYRPPPPPPTHTHTHSLSPIRCQAIISTDAGLCQLDPQKETLIKF